MGYMKWNELTKEQQDRTIDYNVNDEWVRKDAYVAAENYRNSLKAGEDAVFLRYVDQIEWWNSLDEDYQRAGRDYHWLLTSGWFCSIIVLTMRVPRCSFVFRIRREEEEREVNRRRYTYNYYILLPSDSLFSCVWLQTRMNSAASKWSR